MLQVHNRLPIVSVWPAPSLVTFTMDFWAGGNLKKGFLFFNSLFFRNVYFLSASPDGHLDYSRIHILSLQSQQLTTQFAQPDPQRGLPSARKQAALDSTSGRFYQF